jgi:hypothetical protein
MLKITVTVIVPDDAATIRALNKKTLQSVEDTVEDELARKKVEVIEIISKVTKE